jgi:hypothetical protein
MYARIMSIEWPEGHKVEGMDEVLKAVREHHNLLAKQLHGLKGFIGLSQGVRVVIVSLWETGADPQISAADSYLEWLKDKFSFLPNLSITPLWLRDYEIFALELPQMEEPR